MTVYEELDLIQLLTRQLEDLTNKPDYLEMVDLDTLERLVGFLKTQVTKLRTVADQNPNEAGLITSITTLKTMVFGTLMEPAFMMGPEILMPEKEDCMDEFKRVVGDIEPPTREEINRSLLPAVVKEFVNDLVALSLASRP